jgi:hypothetical protein
MQTLNLDPSSISHELPSGRLTADALATVMSDYLAPFPVTQFFTLTWSKWRERLGNFEDDHRRQQFHEWHNALEILKGGPIGYLYGIERRYSGVGRPGIATHLHGCLVGHLDLNAGLAHRLWKGIAGDAEILRYVTGGGAIRYSLKKAFYDIGDWDLGNLAYYAPGPVTGASAASCRKLAKGAYLMPGMNAALLRAQRREAFGSTHPQGSN